MMKNKKSGWAGKVKVTMAIIFTAIFSVIIIQCNLQLEEQVPAQSEMMSTNDFTDGINLPVLPDRKDPVVVDHAETLNFNISGNKLNINGAPFRLEEIVPLIKEGDYSPSLVIVMRIDKDQKMDFIRDVQTEIRKAEMRKINYLGKTNTGEKVETPLLLPPLPENEGKYHEPSPNDMIDSGNLDLLKIDMGNNIGPANQQNVYDFIKSHMQKQSSDYVVSARFGDADSYNDYLLNLVYIKDGFNQIYKEIAQEMFGKELYEMDKEEFQAVRKGVPMAISIAD